VSLHWQPMPRARPPTRLLEQQQESDCAVIEAAQKQHLSFGASKLTSMVRNMAVSIFGNIPAVHRKLQVELSQTEFVYRDGPLVALGGSKRSVKRTEVGARARFRSSMRQPARTPACGPIFRRVPTAC
jgi:hypothetical protein